VISPDDGKLSLELLELPRETRIPGPGQAQQTMTSDAGVRQQITFLQGQGSQATIVPGNLLSLPYADGLLYVEPVYIKLQQANPFPLLRLVLVSYGTQVGYAPTLPAAIQVMVDKNPSQTPPSQTPPNQTPPQNPLTGLTPALQAAAQKIDKAISDLQAAQKNADFAAQGKALADLEAAMNDWKTAAAAAGLPSTTPPTPAPTG
jgi:uncharacterized membrane protein (UPF0182 family)